MLLKELFNKKTEDLIKLEEEARAELFALRFQASIGNLEKPHRIKELRRTIARILTVLSERRANGENTNLNVKVDLQKTIEKVEKDAKVFAKKRRSELEKAMAEQSKNSDAADLNNQLANLDLDSALDTDQGNNDDSKELSKEQKSNKKTTKKTDAKKGEQK